MPEGYEEYVVFSEFQAAYQRHLRSVRRISPGADGVAVRENGGAVVVVAQLDPGKFPRRFSSYVPAGTPVRIAGGGARRYELEREIPANVRFVGRLAARDVPGFLADAAVGLVLTEMYEDAVPMALIEMLAAGLPVVARPWGSVPEWIVSGENGTLADSEEETAAAIREYLHRPRRHTRRPPSRAEMQSAFRSLVGELVR
jgi:glycosyltransferase involved in cell wall biosynthesis